MTSNYDASIKQKTFEVGAFVLVYTPPKQQQRQVYGKWKVAWQGPYTVIKKLNSTNYIVKRPSRAKDFVVHGDRLKLYHGEIDASAWPTDSRDGQQSGPAPAGIASTGDPDPVSQPPPAQLGSAQTSNQRQRSGSGRSRDDAGQPACSAFHSGPRHTGHMVPPATSINYDQQLNGPISDDGFSASRPRRKCRRPARFLSRVAAAELYAGTESRSVPGTGYLLNNTVDISDLSANERDCRLVVLNERSVVRTMPDKGKRPAQKRRRNSSRDRGDEQNGRRPIGVCRPRVVFVPRQCRLCQDDDNVPDDLRRKFYASRNAMNKHTVLKHDRWYHPKRDKYVCIAPEDLECVRARYHSWQSH